MNNNMKILDDKKERMNITFKTTHGNVNNIKVDYGTSIDDMLKKYLKHINHPELINNKNDIAFLYNAQILIFGDKTKIEDYFKYNNHPNIIVNDLKNLCL